MKIMKKTYVLIIGIFIIFSINSEAKDNYLEIYKEKAKLYKIDYKTLRAIAEVESDNIPYVINVNKKEKKYEGSHVFKTVKEADEYMDKVLEKNKLNYDIGICQINSWWLKRLKLKNEDLLNPTKNIEISARILKHNLYICNNNLECALSVYNTGKKDSKVGNLYAKKVLKARKRIFND